ncbi:porwaprin-b [Alligator mississippiensis]|uniref:porwaprin-b n=1 Tax=Alligator mississippiensis TaxID=8496 RepID=UPI002877F658|nr:porwaprin-b [Alligator mississippiensis]
MKWSSLLVLAGLLALWARLQPASGQLVPGKPGMCLLNPMWCSKPQPNECSSDFQCRGRLKCCYWRCAWRCEEPVQVISRPSLRKRHREEQV